MWMANLVLATIGVAILIFQRRPGSDVFSVLRSLRHAWPTRKSYLERERRTNPANVDPSQNGRKRFGNTRNRRTAASRTLIQPQLIDRLVLSDLIRSFFF